MAPPKRYVNIRTNITGVIVTSSSCSGTCLTLSIPRQPNVSAALSGDACGGRGVVVSTLRMSSVLIGPPRALPASPARARLGLEIASRISYRDLLLCEMAGQGQEDLVEARLAE